MSDEEYGEVLRQARDGVDFHFEEAGFIEGARVRRLFYCSYCGQLISVDPTDSESWVHVLSADAQCIVDGVKLDGYAEPAKEGQL